MEFCARRDCFDPGKGNLKNYLIGDSLIPYATVEKRH